MLLKRLFKNNTHNLLFKLIAGVGTNVNRLYENRNHDALSNGELTVLKKLSKVHPNIIFDVGANKGHYAKLILDTNPDAHIYCFEPVNDTYAILERSFGDQVPSNVTLIKKGLYKVNSDFEINIFPSNEHASLFDLRGINYSYIRKEKIDLVSLDSFAENHRIGSIDFVKLDLEGAEMDALLGMKNALSMKKIRAIQFEYGYINVTTRNLLADYYDFFKKYDYVIGKIYPKTVEFRDYRIKHEDFIGPNYIAVRKDDSELIRLLS